MEANTKQTNIDPKAADENARSGFPFLAVPPVFDGLAEQNMTRAREGIEKVKSAAGAINEAVRDACSNNARCAAEYAAKVIEFSQKTCLLFVNSISFTILLYFDGLLNLNELFKINRI